jgi:hypothetical protein
LDFQADGATSTSPTTLWDQKPSTPNTTVLPNVTLPTVANTTNDDNSTVPVLQITDYHYFDWPKIGYHIFMGKMMDALQTLKFFLSLDPMLLKITRTFILTNNTNLNFTDGDVSGKDDDEISSIINNVVETNTESPLKAQLGNSKDTSYKEKTPLMKMESNNSEALKDVSASKTENSGFFSSIAEGLSGAYHTIIGWF